MPGTLAACAWTVENAQNDAQIGITKHSELISLP